MAGTNYSDLQRRKVPWCTFCLVVCATTCHLLVFIGNYKTALAMNELGKATAGWSNVGLGLGRALQDELDDKMMEVSEKLLDSLEQISFVQDELDIVLSLVGNETDEAISNSSELSFLQQHGPEAFIQLKESEGRNGTGAVSALIPMITQSVHNILQGAMDRISDLLGKFFSKLKPALEQVGQWIIKFGDQIQSALDMFSVTIDKVQKIFDQVMAQLNGNGDNLDMMLEQTFGLFDSQNRGFVSAEDLKEVANAYTITALQGDLSEELVEKYDSNGDAVLNKQELGLMVEDPAIPNSMSTILRTYARRLSEIAGQVEAGRMRDEVALSVSRYFQLVCAKNMTKVGWVSDRLGNGSLPLEFTTAVLVQLCLSEDDPNSFTSVDVGNLVLGEMYRLHPNQTLAAYDQMSNNSFWASEGFNLQDQPKCVNRATTWLTNAMGNSTEGISEGSSSEGGTDLGGAGNVSMIQFISSAQRTGSHQKIIEAMPMMAQKLSEEGVYLYFLERHQTNAARHRMLFSSSTSRHLLATLSRGKAAGGAGVAQSPAERAINGGQRAAPETLQFARWLANNATQNANIYQEMCFEYSSESSNAIDSFATQIKGMAEKIVGFITKMQTYSTPAGIQRLEDQVMNFAQDALHEVMDVIEGKIVSLLNQSGPAIDNAIHNAAHQAGEALGRMLSNVVATPLGDALVGPLSDVIGDMANNPEAGASIGEQLGSNLGGFVANLTTDAVGDILGDALEDLVSSALSHITPPSGQQSLLESKAQGGGGSKDFSAKVTSREVGTPFSGAWTAMTELLVTLTNLLPSASDILKKARDEVSKLASNIDSIFETFEEKGPNIFDLVAKFYRLIWAIYFVFLLLLNAFVLYYGFWASGYFGGPSPLPDGEEEVEGPRTWGEKCMACCACCSTCMKRYHDSDICLWSFIVLFQVVVLVIFVVSIVLCVLAGIKAFLVVGCSQVYILADQTVCTDILTNVQGFLETFGVGDTPISTVCDSHSLLVCDLISQKMQTSTILTTVFSLLGALLSMQMIIDSALLHEQARWRRLAYQGKDDQGASAAQSSGSQ